MEDPEKTASASNKGTSQDPSDKDKGKNFQQRVEEFSMWKDEGTFLEMEYKRRRSEKKKRKGTIRNDERLVMSNRLYIPIFVIITASVCILLLSSIDGIAEDSVFWTHQGLFQIIGGIGLALGFFGLMVVAAYTYQREDKVRAKYGYPSLFMSSLKGQVSTKNLEESIMLQNTFVDRPRGSSRNLQRLNSMDSQGSVNNLAQSFSSASTAVSWVHKHRHHYRLQRQSSLRRESSDSALDKIFARKQILNWQTDSSACAPENYVESDQLEETNIDDVIMQCDTKDVRPADWSQKESSYSMASSGYCSTISTHGVALNSHKPLIRHLSEPARGEGTNTLPTRWRLLSERTIPDEEAFEEQLSLMPSVPSIRIECA